MIIDDGFRVSNRRLGPVDLEIGQYYRLVLRIILAVALRHHLDEVRDRSVQRVRRSFNHSTIATWAAREFPCTTTPT
jgi:hypothetical protein